MPISRFLDPKNDYVFWKVFGTEKNKDVLIAFLNHVLCLEDKDQIIDVTFLDPRQSPEVAAYRQSIVDVLCKDQNGVQIIVEMQVSRHAGFEKRAQYYAAKAYSRQIIKEDENHKKMAVYAKLKAVIFLAIADFMMFPEKEAWMSEHYLLDNKTYEHDLKDFHFIFLELPKFKKTLDDLSSIQDKWMYFFKHAEESTLEEIEKLVGKDVIIKRAFYAIDQASWTPEELTTYEQREKNLLDNQAVEDYKLFEAKEKGKKEGRDEGIEIGEARGEAKLREEKLKIAQEMLKSSIDINLISQITNLSLDQIKELAK